MCYVYRGGEEDCSHQFIDCPYVYRGGGYMCVPEDLRTGCQISRGMLGISNRRHKQEGGREGKTLHCAMVIMAAP